MARTKTNTRDDTKTLTTSWRNRHLENWWKGKPSGSIACTRKQQPRFYWSCSSVVMNDATPLTPPSAWAELPFSNVNNIHVHSMNPEDQKNMTTQTYIFVFFGLLSYRLGTVNDFHWGFKGSFGIILNIVNSFHIRGT